MDLKIEQIDDVVVVSATGMLTGGKETDALQETLTKLMVEENRKKILLNVSGVEFLGSPSIGVIGAAHGHARDHESNFWICGMRKRVQRVFELMKFGPELRAFDSCDEALEAFQDL